MIKQKALVTKVMPGRVEVEVAVKSSCSGCSSADSCGVGTVAKAFTGKTQFVVIATEQILAPGQWVTIATQEANLLILAALTYLLPLVGLVLVGGLAQQLLESEGVAIIFSLLGGYGFQLIAKRLIKARETRLPTILII